VGLRGTVSVQVTSSFEYNEKPLGSVRGGEFSELLCDCQLLKTDSAACN